MKKKSVLQVISMLLIAAMLTGCGDGAGSRQEIVQNAKESVSKTDSKESAPDKKKQDNKQDQDNKKETEKETEPEIAPVKEESIETQVLIDQDGLKITAKELSKNYMGKCVTMLIENDTDKDLGVSVDAVIVNNYMVSDFFSSTVASGKKANEELSLRTNELEAAGIENIGQIEIYFHTFNPDNYKTLEKFDKVTIQTSYYDTMDVVALDNGVELVNKDGVRIVGKYVENDTFWGKSILLYLENNTGKNITVQCDDLSVNGFMMTGIFSSTVYDGKMAVDDISLLSSELEQNGITSIDEVELKFKVFNADSFKRIFETDPITFQTK